MLFHSLRFLSIFNMEELNGVDNPKENRMAQGASTIKVTKAILSNPQMIAAKPSVNWFFCKYLRKFKVVDVGGKLILHSHLPPLNGKPYARFVKEHLLAKTIGPSHAQIGVTNACPQDCEYCYNKTRAGKVMSTETILQIIRDLKELGVFWIGLTGGEPLLNKNIVRIVESIGDDCASKLFTTGCTLTKERAADLKSVGLFSVSISLDHWEAEKHDAIRRYEGAFRTALNAIDIFKNLGGIHVSVSAVLSKEMLKRDIVERFLAFLEGLGIHEAWLSETKPSAGAPRKKDLVISRDEREMLIEVQDEHNRNGGMTVNYLGHFEDARYFGCTAGHKMVYVDAFGEVSPCVFIPMTFGNVKNESVKNIYTKLRMRFPTENTCFINKNFERLRDALNRQSPIGEDDALQIVDNIDFGPLAEFFRLQYR
jgi:MoaA/NifB/PqqE/SkfB family radical SAM enzyme